MEQQYLLFTSLTLYTAELALFLWIKHLVQNDKPFSNLILEQLSVYIRHINSEHIAIYSFVYFLLLLISQFVGFFYTIVITIQLISVSLDAYVVLLLRKKD